MSMLIDSWFANVRKSFNEYMIDVVVGLMHTSFMNLSH